jgi:hypothetical protein
LEIPVGSELAREFGQEFVVKHCWFHITPPG